jgi:hypothetical protein
MDSAVVGETLDMYVDLGILKPEPEPTVEELVKQAES